MIKFVIDLCRETVPTFIKIKHIVDQALEMDFFKVIALGASITVGIGLLKQAPKIIEKLRTWGRY